MFKPQYKQLISVDFKPSSLHKSRSIVTVSSFAFSTIASRFPQLLKCDTDMVASYRVVPYLQLYCNIAYYIHWLGMQGIQRMPSLLKAGVYTNLHESKKCVK